MIYLFKIKFDDEYMRICVNKLKNIKLQPRELQHFYIFFGFCNKFEHQIIKNTRFNKYFFYRKHHT